MIEFTSCARIDRITPLPSGSFAAIAGRNVIARCGTLQETEAVKAACDELPTRAARALNLAQSGAAMSAGVEPTPQELTALQLIIGVAVVGKEVRSAYDAVLERYGTLEGLLPSQELLRFVQALTTLKIVIAAGAPL
jgi:hypothetical protein